VRAFQASWQADQYAIQVILSPAQFRVRSSHDNPLSPCRVPFGVNALKAAYLKTILKVIPRAALRDVFFKGSAFQVWDDLVDYVPELSDVDIHVWFQDDDGFDKTFPTLEAALKFSAKAEARFFAACPKPLHVPRVQLIALNRLLNGDRFVASPANVTHSHFGLDYPSGRHITPEAIRMVDAASLLEEAEQVLNVIRPERMIDKHSKDFRAILCDLGERIGPLVSRAMSLLGSSFEEAWGGHNRSSLLLKLEAQDQHDLVSGIRGFYEAAWTYFPSQDRDGNAARTAIRHAANALEIGRQIAHKQKDGPEAAPRD
jgi:hypothetical protein